MAPPGWIREGNWFSNAEVVSLLVKESRGITVTTDWQEGCFENNDCCVDLYSTSLSTRDQKKYISTPKCPLPPPFLSWRLTFLGIAPGVNDRRLTGRPRCFNGVRHA